MSEVSPVGEPVVMNARDKSPEVALRDQRELSPSNPASVLPTTPPSSMGRRLFSFPVVLTCALVYLVFLFSRRNIADPDLGYHLRNAQYLLTTGHLPIFDRYSFTVPGTVVIPFEWLAEIPYYLAYKWAGLPAVFLVVFLLSTAIVLGIFRLSYLASHDVKNSFMVTVGAAVMAAVSIGARTLLFGWLYLVILLLILEAVRSNRRKWLWLVPPLFCIWVNSHASWPMGMVVLGIFIVSGMVDGVLGHAYATRWAPRQLRALLITAGASVLAVFINPLGYRLVLYPFEAMFGAHTGVGMTSEFASIDFQTPWGKVAIILIVGSLLIAVFSQERWRLDEVALIALALYYSLTYLRFIFLAAILLPPIFAKRLKLMTPYDHNTDKRLYNAVALAVLVCLFLVSAPARSRFHNPVRYPEGAVAYMKANGIQGRLFHEWVWGGYLIWHMPESKVFIDGRADPYGPTGVFKDYLSAISNDDPQAVFDKYQIEYILMPPDSPLANYLKSSQGWTIQYRDEASMLFRRSPRP